MGDMQILAFDILKSGYKTVSFPLVSAAVTLLLIFALISLRYSAKLNLSFNEEFVSSRLWGWIAVGGSITAFMFVWTFGDYCYLVKMTRSHHYQVLQGCMTSFLPAPPGGHIREQINIAGRKFSYTPSEITNAFNQTVSEGGPVRADSRLSVFAVGNRIVRLEIAQHACPFAPLPADEI